MHPIDPAPLGLTESAVALFSAQSVDAAEMLYALSTIDAGVDTVVLISEVSQIDTVRDMLERFANSDGDGVAASKPVAEAVKRVHESIVTAGMDRNHIVMLAWPQVLSRTSLADTLRPLTGKQNPAAAMARSGARILLYNVPDTK